MRALPRTCSPSTSRSGTDRWARIARRRANNENDRGIRPTSALSDDSASPKRPVNNPTISSTNVSNTIWTERPTKPRATGQSCDDAHPVPGTQPAVVQIRASLLEQFEVPDPGVGSDDDPGAVEVGPPAQVDVVAVEADRRIEAAELAQQVSAHEDARRREHEHVADGVVLFLVDLAGLDDRVDLTEPVEAESDVLQPARLLPLDELGTDHAGVRAVQLGDHRPHRVRRRRDVVVAEQEEPVVALDESQDLVGRRARTPDSRRSHG